MRTYNRPQTAVQNAKFSKCTRFLNGDERNTYLTHKTDE